MLPPGSEPDGGSSLADLAATPVVVPPRVPRPGDCSTTPTKQRASRPASAWKRCSAGPVAPRVSGCRHGALSSAAGRAGRIVGLCDRGAKAARAATGGPGDRKGPLTPAAQAFVTLATERAEIDHVPINLSARRRCEQGGEREQRGRLHAVRLSVVPAAWEPAQAMAKWSRRGGRRRSARGRGRGDRGRRHSRGGHVGGLLDGGRQPKADRVGGQVVPDWATAGAAAWAP